MPMKRQIPDAPLPQCVLDGVIQSNKPTSVTTIWRDGDVVRTDAWGRSRVRASVRPIAEPAVEPERRAA